MKDMKIITLAILIFGALVFPSKNQAQKKVYPHLQVFLISSEPERKTPFIAFWDNAHELAAGPFPLQLLELAGLSVYLDLSYEKPTDEVPNSARLKIKNRESSPTQPSAQAGSLGKEADRIVNAGVSKMFPKWPFLIVGHDAPSEEVLWVGGIMKEVQAKMIACDQEYRTALGATLNSMKDTPSYDIAVKALKQNFQTCPG